jgi:hypothetical protein
MIPEPARSSGRRRMAVSLLTPTVLFSGRRVRPGP